MSTRIEYLLKNIKEAEQSLAIRKHVIEQNKKPEYKDIIESLTFFKAENGCVSGGAVSDKTASIAERYKLVAWLDNKQLLESETECLCERRELDLLYCAIEQLPDKHRQIIKSLYIEGLSWRETADNMGFCTSTIKKYVDNSIKRLSEMMQKSW